MILQSNALHIPLADNSVQCVVTSPPYYGLRDYGVAGQLGLERTPAEYVANIVSVMREVWRVMKADGTLWLNIGDSYNGSGKGGVFSDKSAKQATNIGANIARPMRLDCAKPKDLLGIPWRVAFALQADGWYLRSDIIWHKPNPMPESVTDRPTKSHEYMFLLSKSERYYYDAEAIKEKQAESTGPRMLRGVSDVHKNINGAPGQPAHTMNQPRENNKQDGVGKATYTGFNSRYIPVERVNKRTVWTIATQSYSGAHFATFPEKLVEPCILAGSRPGDIVLDPFSGSGTTARVAIKHRRRAVGLELNPAYIGLAHDRMTVQITL